MEFKEFRQLLTNHVNKFDKLYLLDISKEKMWNAYINGFSQEEQQEHNCNCCRNFINHYGNLATIVDNKIISIWDFEIEGTYNKSVKNLLKLTEGVNIIDIFINETNKLGTHHNVVLENSPLSKINKKGLRYDHLYLKVNCTISNTVIADKAASRATVKTFERALKEITSVDKVITIIKKGIFIDPNTQKAIRIANEDDNEGLVQYLYRGKEMLPQLEVFKKYQDEYNATSNKEVFIWTINISTALSRIRNSAIGTLLKSFSDNNTFDYCIKSYTNMMADYKEVKVTYKVTKKDIENAKKTLIKLNYIDNLDRRFANISDINIPDILWKGETTNIKGDVFDILSTKVIPKKSKNIINITIDKFIKDILPLANKLEILVDKPNNIMTLLTATNANSKSMLKWERPFTWSYINGKTDSIKQSVKKLGGKVDVDFRFSIEWSDENKEDNSDLDAWCLQPNRPKVYFNNMRDHITGCNLDVDITDPYIRNYKDIVENIVIPDKNQMIEGDYTLQVHNYSNSGNKGFRAEFEYCGTIYSFEYNKPLKNRETVTVIKFNYSKKNGIKILSQIPSSLSSKEICNISTQTYQEVSLMMLSPNHWNKQTIGNKHYFFILKDAKFPEVPKGFFNEFLNDELKPHRKVLEMLSTQMKVKYSGDQLTGLGFSDTIKNEVTIKVTHNYSQTYKISI